MFYVCFTMYNNVLPGFYDVLLCLTMVSESRNDRHCWQSLAIVEETLTSGKYVSLFLISILNMYFPISILKLSKIKRDLIGHNISKRLRTGSVLLRQLISQSAVSRQPASQSGLQKIPIYPWLVTLSHICRVIPTLQSLISAETSREHWYCHTERRYHNVLSVSCFISSSQCFTCVSRCITIFYKCFMMFYYV